MGFEVRWSPEAIEDMSAIAGYIERDSEYYARAVVTELLSVSKNIGEFPMIGRIVPETGDKHIRERFIYSYRLVYQVETERILIVAVIHGKRQLSNISERF